MFVERADFDEVVYWLELCVAVSLYWANNAARPEESNTKANLALRKR